MAVKELDVESLRIDGGTQLRAKIDEATVAEYREAWANDAKFPPLIVYHDGADHWLAGGFHRYHGAKAACVPTVPCEVRKGTLRDAILFAAGDNATNGLRRTNEDKRKAVRTLLEDAEWGKMSDRQIAEACCVGPPLVADVRSQVKEITPGSGEPEKRTGKDGKQYSVAKKKPKPDADPPAKKNPPGGTSFNPAEWDAPAAEAEKPAEQTKPVEVAKDEEGRTLPEKLRPVFARRSELRELEETLQKVAKKLDEKQNDPLYAHIHVQSTVADIDNAKRAIRFSKPHAVCPYCKGTGKACKACKGQGWVPKSIFRQAPAEARA